MDLSWPRPGEGLGMLGSHPCPNMGDGTKQPTSIISKKYDLLVLNVGNGWVAGGCCGLLGWLLIVRQWIIPENSLLSTSKMIHQWISGDLIFRPIFVYVAMDQYLINTIFSGMNIHLPAILMFTRGTRFWHTAMCVLFVGWHCSVMGCDGLVICRWSHDSQVVDSPYLEILDSVCHSINIIYKYYIHYSSLVL